MNTLFIKTLLSNMRLVIRVSFPLNLIKKILKIYESFISSFKQFMHRKTWKIEHETQKSLSMFILGFEVEKGLWNGYKFSNVRVCFEIIPWIYVTVELLLFSFVLYSFSNNFFFIFRITGFAHSHKFTK